MGSHWFNESHHIHSRLLPIGWMQEHDDVTSKMNGLSLTQQVPLYKMQTMPYHKQCWPCLQGGCGDVCDDVTSKMKWLSLTQRVPLQTRPNNPKVGHNAVMMSLQSWMGSHWLNESHHIQCRQLLKVDTVMCLRYHKYKWVLTDSMSHIHSRFFL